MSYTNAIDAWEAGERRLRCSPPARRATLERVRDRIVDELRRRLGGAFTASELAALYEAGTDWCLDVAVSVAPDAPWAWEPEVVIDAAFARYLRASVDHAGGRRRDAQD